MHFGIKETQLFKFTVSQWGKSHMFVPLGKLISVLLKLMILVVKTYLSKIFILFKSSFVNNKVNSIII